MAVPVFVSFTNELPDQTLRPVDDSYEPVAQDSIIECATPIHFGNDAVVYKGTMRSGDGCSAKDVILKFISARRLNAYRRLQNEFQFYKNQLRELQGTVVPKCYGLFKTHRDLSMCLILQDCGEPVQVEFNLLEPNLLMDILDHLLELHERGVQHGDLVEHNVLIKDGKPFIIDFEHATAHTCKRREDIFEGTIAPLRYEFGCAEIYDWCYEFGIWRSGTFAFAGIAVPESMANSEQVLIEAARDHGATVSDRILKVEAKKAFRMMQAIKDNKGLMPRQPKLEALMREVENELASSR